MTVFDQRWWMEHPDRCCASVTRNYEEEACDKPAVAVAAFDGEEYEPHTYPVCRHHARGREMLLLADIIRIVREEAE